MKPTFTGAWRYFGRRGPSQIYEIYRLPATVKRVTLDDTLRMERLRKDGSWFHNPQDQGIYREMAGGWFDDDDEITIAHAQALVATWEQSQWPGRD